MPLSEYLSLTFQVSLEYEEALKGYFLLNYDVQGFEESSTGLLTIYLPAKWDPEDESELEKFLAAFPKKEIQLIESEAIEEKDWNAAWEAEIEPVKISDELVISPSWKLNE